MILRARYVLDARITPRDDYAVRIDGERIVEVGPARSICGEDAIDLGDALLMPGFVNAHTHLELGFAAGAVPPSPDFVDWLRRLLVVIRAAASDETAVTEAVASGLRASLESGVTLLGDITRDPYRTRPAIAGEGRRPAVVSFGEVIAFGGILPQADEKVLAALDRANARDDLTIGISPHAPYTVHRDVLDACVRHARSTSSPLCIHAAESLEEERYLLEGDGPLRDYFVELGLWSADMEPAGCRSILYLDRTGALGPGCLLAHCNYVSDEEIARLAETGTHVVFCPRTHAAFSHDPHPFRKMLEAGVSVCLGTDSLASNPDLSILNEMRFVQRAHEELPPQTLFKMATQAGAEALGRGDETGAIEAGRRADLAVIPLDQDGPGDPIENILASVASPALVIVGGRVVELSDRD